MMKKKDSKSTEDICKVPWIEDINQANISPHITAAYRRLVPPNSFEMHETPFHYKVYGCYVLNMDWEMLMIMVKRSNDPTRDYSEFQRVKVFENLKDYARGFDYGFHNFISDKILSATSLTNSDSYKVQKIMDFISNPFSRSGFSRTHEDGKDIFAGWYNDGVKAGYHYCAWYTILENHKSFESHFVPNQTDDRNFPKPPKPESEHNQIAKILNNFDAIKIEDVFAYFRTELVVTRHLTETNLSNYLMIAFDKKTLPENRFKLTGVRTKQKIINIFYRYYLTCAGKPHGRQNDYAALLGNYFEGFNTNNVITNFSK